MTVENSARVLIVEDDDDVRHMFSTLLSSKGYLVTCAAAAVGGVSAAHGMRPDIIIMDLGLPDSDGFSAVRALRSDAKFSGVPILIVSAYDTMQFRTEALEAGCTGYMVKPVDPERLLETVRLFIPADRDGESIQGGVRDEDSVG